MHVYRAPGAAPPPPAESHAGVVVCGRCGVVAPARGRACEVCKASLDEVRAHAPRADASGDSGSDDAFWVAVRCAFTCNSCKFLAPLDALDADGAVDCAHCGLHQRFEVAAWSDALAFAHAVGDLAGPSLEGRSPHPTLWIGDENPHASVGDTRTFERIDRVAGSSLAIEAAPGHPVCKRCRALVAITSAGGGAASTRCARCGDEATYAIADASRLSTSLVAVVADEHRTDRPRATATATQAGVFALTCPSCGGPLTVGEGGRLQTCSFCEATCVVPARSLARAGGDMPSPEVWWMLFRGPSSKRRALESPVAAPVVAVKDVVRLFKPGIDKTPIGDAPGVYDAPEVPGIYWPQVALTLLLGTAAVAMGMGLYEALSP